MKIIRKLIEYSIFSLMFLGIGIVAILFIIVVYPFNYFEDKKSEKEFTNFLIRNEGRNFFCYNNKRFLLPFIEQEIIPNLAENIEIVYLEGRVVKKEEAHFFGMALRQLKNYEKFPHLMKIRNGKLIDKSINDSNHRIKRMSKDEMFLEINSFFVN